MRRIVTLGLVVLLISGCAAQPAAHPNPAATPTAPSTPEPAPSLPPAPEPAAGTRPNTPNGLKPEPAGGLKELISRAPDGSLQRVQLAAGQPISRDGVYFLNVQSSAVEGWVVGDPAKTGYLRFMSDDNRWISGGPQRTGFLADRQTGSVYQWDATAAGLVAARGDLLLMMTGSRLWVVGDGLKRFTPVDLTPVGEATAEIAPDGSTVLLVTGQKLYLIQTTSGQAQALAPMTPPATAENAAVTMSRGPQGREVIATLTYSAGGVWGRRIRRYSWQGQMLDERTASGTAFFSPDGKAVAWVDSILGLTRALIVGTADFQPRLRLRGHFTCSLPNQGPFWLADSSALVVSTTRGPRLLKLDGSLESLAAAGTRRTFGIPVPAPDRLNLYAVGGDTVVDGSGKQLAAAVSANPNGWPAVLLGNPWGERSDELRFILLSLGKGASCDPQIFDPSVDRAPFPVVTGLAVKVAAGDCVNLRQAANKEAPVLTCLPDGTRLVPAAAPGTNHKGELWRYGNPQPTGMDDFWWWYVRTPQGQRGYVYLSQEYLSWDEVRPGEMAPDALLAREGDELANLRYWLRIAVGPEACGSNCTEDGLVPVLSGLMTWCKAVPAELRADPTFSAARHDAGLAPIAGTCQALLAAPDSLGQISGDPKWYEKARELLAGLPDAPIGG